MVRLSFPLVAAVVGTLAVGGAIVLNVTDDAVTVPGDDPIIAEPDTMSDTAAAPEAADSAESASTDPVEESPASEAAPTVPPSPSFDVVRIDEDGSTVVAGRALPGAEIEIHRDGTVIGTVVADDRGEWVFVPGDPLEPGNAVLSLAMKPKGDDLIVPSEEDVIVIIPNRAVAASDDGAPTDQTGEPTQAVVMKVAKDGTSTLLQHPEPIKVIEGSELPLSIDTVDYDEAGRISIGGRAPPGASVVLYVDNGVVGRATADESGTWRVTPEIAIAPGVHTVRADRIDPEQGVIARVMIPFAREAFDEPLTAGDFVVVQPGNSLWRLARRTYGTGFEYTVIYKANADQIADPDLIYPGQIFKLPATN